MFQETIYYAEQAHKLVQLIDSGAHLATAVTATGSTWLSAGKLDKASEFFLKAKELSMASYESQTAVVLNCQLGRLHGLLDNREAALAAYIDANTVLETLSSVKYISDIDRINNPAAVLEEEMSRLTLKVTKPTVSRKGVGPKKASNKKSVTTSKVPVEIPTSISDECIRLLSLKGLLLRQKAGALMSWKRCEEAVAVLKEADAFLRNDLDLIDHHMNAAKQLLQQSVEQMSADPVYSVLQDSTISFPAVVSSSRAPGSTEKAPGTRVTPPRRHQGSTSAREPHRPKSPSPSGFFGKLRQAQDRLTEAHSVAVRLSSTAVIHSLSSLLCAINILLYAAGPSLGKNVAHPNLATCSMGKSNESKREVSQAE
jgi:separase